jgi:hypothetical protein
MGLAHHRDDDGVSKFSADLPVKPRQVDDVCVVRVMGGLPSSLIEIDLRRGLLRKRPIQLRVSMCFSPTGDLVGGTVVVGIGIDACLHLKHRFEYVAIATMPIVLGLHQIDETFVWWWLQGHVDRSVGVVAMWLYLLFALVALPTIVPVVVYFFTPRSPRRRALAPFIALGVIVSGILLEAMLVGNPHARLGTYHVAYTIGLKHGIAIIGLYIVATCGPFLASGFRPMQWFGVANLLAVVVLALLCASGFTSLWCFYAALVGGAVALHLRLQKAPLAT